MRRTERAIAGRAECSTNNLPLMAPDSGRGDIGVNLPDEKRNTTPDQQLVALRLKVQRTLKDPACG